MEPAESAGPLQLATTQELLDELGRRHTSWLAVFEKPSNEKGADTSDRRICYGGGWTQALGLLEYLYACLHEQLRRTAGRVEDADEERRRGED